VTGFLISRLGVRYGLIERFFARGLARRHDSVTSFLLALMVSTALISMFIPNFITALALLPVLENLQKHFEQQFAPHLVRRLTTAMVLAAIYGCNIGGMGSLIGSPANALMLGALELYQAPGREKVNFLSWFGWSLPLTAILIGCAWAQLVYVFQQHRGHRGVFSGDARAGRAPGAPAVARAHGRGVGCHQRVHAAHQHTRQRCCMAASNTSH
jgi:sodium-dependent dicarboxylate transporter 2/3/5